MGRNIIQGLKFGKQPEGFDARAFSKAIEEGYLQGRRDSEFKQKKTFSPSSIGYGHGTCPRYWYLAFNGAQFDEKTDAMGVANMMNGSSAHDRIQGVLEKAGVVVSLETEMKLSDPPVRGYIDALVRFGEQVVVGEIKTTRQESFAIKQMSMKASENHMIQILLYMKATGKRFGFIMYENKNTQEYLVIPVEFTKQNEEKLEEVLDWLRKVYKNWQEGELPVRPFRQYKGKPNKVCSECPLTKTCWEDQPEGKVEIEKMTVPKF